MSQYVFGGPASVGSGSPGGGSTSKLSSAAASGLADTFMIFLIVLVIAGLLALFALRTYPRDVATAAASAQAIARSRDGSTLATSPPEAARAQRPGGG